MDDNWTATVCSSYSSRGVLIMTELKAEVERLTGVIESMSGDAYAALNPANWQTRDTKKNRIKCYEATLRGIEDKGEHFNVIDKFYGRIKAAEAREAALWEAFETFGDHSLTCSVAIASSRPEPRSGIANCDCGFVETLATKEVDKGKSRRLHVNPVADRGDTEGFIEAEDAEIRELKAEVRRLSESCACCGGSGQMDMGSAAGCDPCNSTGRQPKGMRIAEVRVAELETALKEIKWHMDDNDRAPVWLIIDAVLATKEADDG